MEPRVKSPSPDWIIQGQHTASSSEYVRPFDTEESNGKDHFSCTFCWLVVIHGAAAEMQCLFTIILGRSDGFESSPFNEPSDRILVTSSSACRWMDLNIKEETKLPLKVRKNLAVRFSGVKHTQQWTRVRFSRVRRLFVSKSCHETRHLLFLVVYFSLFEMPTVPRM